MTGNETTPGAVQIAQSTHPILVGPLSWMIESTPSSPAANAPITAIWRNETGTAMVQTAAALS